LRQTYIVREELCHLEVTEINGVPLNITANDCNDFLYSTTISAGIGFIFLGNIYDNIDTPRQITVLLLVILAIISVIEGTFKSKNDGA
jgi:hypothetical protein